MSKTFPLDDLIQQLDALPLEQLLEVRAKVDALIEKKSSSSDENQQFSSRYLGSYRWETVVQAYPRDVDVLVRHENIGLIDAATSKSLLEIGRKIAVDKSIIAIITKGQAKNLTSIEFIERDGEDESSEVAINEVALEDESLEDVIELVEEWMSDESGYDEETYPQIEAALNQNRLSL